MIETLVAGAGSGFVVGMFLYALSEIGNSSRKSVYGRILTQDELMKFFNAHMKEYTVVSKDILGSPDTIGNFITTHSGGRKSKYYIHGVGQIPRKSAYTFLIDQKFEELKNSV